MAKNRKNQAAAVRFAPVIKVLLLCSMFCSLAVGFVWQKSQIYQLGKQISQEKSRLIRLKADNKDLDRQLSDSCSVLALDHLAPSLGLMPAQPMQIVRLPEPAAAPVEMNHSTRQLAVRLADATTQ